MGMYVYCCSKCGNAIRKDSSPSSSGCSRASFHDWRKLGEVGDTNYSCKKCGLMVQTKSSPSSSGCTEASFHDWRKQ